MTRRWKQQPDSEHIQAHSHVWCPQYCAPDSPPRLCLLIKTCSQIIKNASSGMIQTLARIKDPRMTRKYHDVLIWCYAYDNLVIGTSKQERKVVEGKRKFYHRPLKIWYLDSFSEKSEFGLVDLVHGTEFGV